MLRGKLRGAVRGRTSGSVEHFESSAKRSASLEAITVQKSVSIQASRNLSVCSAWQAGVHQAAVNLVSKHQLWQRQSELLPHFTHHYAQLTSLPRRMRRGLQRQWKKSLAGIALLLVLGQTPALAATINVGGGCTLVEAILSANMNTSVGGCRAGSGADRIVLPAGSTQTLTTFNNNPYFYGRSGLPVIRSVITIAGNGGTIRRAPTAPE